ncbi:MAG: hypothetical protein ABEH43_00270, partial [Flavobacteriales bacterium]
YVGNNINDFVSYIRTKTKVTYKDVLDNFSQAKEKIEHLNDRSIAFDILNKIMEKVEDPNKLGKMPKKHVDNFIKFLKSDLIDTDSWVTVAQRLPLPPKGKSMK